MVKENNNLASNAPKVFKDSTDQAIPDIPMDMLANEAALKAITQDTENISNDRVADTQLNLLYSQFVIKLKEFIASNDPSKVKEELDDILSKISNRIQSTQTVDTSEIEKSVSDISQTDVTVKSETPTIEVDLNSEFVQEITNSILNIINFNTIINSTVQKTVETIRSMIDANAKEFKESLDREFANGLQLSKFTKFLSERSEEFFVQDESNTSTSENEEKSLQEAATPPEESLPPEQPSDGEQSGAQSPAEPEKEPQQEEGKSDEEDEKTEQKDPNLDIANNQKLLDLKRKRMLLGVDKTLNDVNQQLRLLIEQKDIVEEYKPREEEEESEISGKTKENKKDKDKKPNEKAEDEESKEKDDESKIDSDSMKTFGKGLLLGTLAVAFILFRGYRTHSMVEDYVKAHQNDNIDQLRADVDREYGNSNVDYDAIDEAVDENTAGLIKASDDSNTFSEFISEAEQGAEESKTTDVDRLTSEELGEGIEEQKSFYTEGIEQIQLPTVRIPDATVLVNQEAATAAQLAEVGFDETEAMVEDTVDATTRIIESSVNEVDTALSKSVQETNEAINGAISQVEQEAEEFIDNAQRYIPPEPILPEDMGIDFVELSTLTNVEGIYSGQLPSTSLDALDSMSYMGGTLSVQDMYEQAIEQERQMNADALESSSRRWAVQLETYKSSANEGFDYIYQNNDVLHGQLSYAYGVLDKVEAIEEDNKKEINQFVIKIQNEQQQLQQNAEDMTHTALDAMEQTTEAAQSTIDTVVNSTERGLNDIEDSIDNTFEEIELPDIPDKKPPTVEQQVEEIPVEEIPVEETQSSTPQPQIPKVESSQIQSTPKVQQVESPSFKPPQSSYTFGAIEDFSITESLLPSINQQNSFTEPPQPKPQPLNVIGVESITETTKWLQDFSSREKENQQMLDSVANTFSVDRMHNLANMALENSTFTEELMAQLQGLNIEPNGGSILVDKEQLLALYANLDQTHALMKRILIKEAKDKNNEEAQMILRDLNLQLA